jgi:hypothetical protein
MRTLPKTFLVIDVESVGLHGQAFAVGGGLYTGNGTRVREFLYSCPPERAAGDPLGREWIGKNVPPMEPTHDTTDDIAQQFWMEWRRARTEDDAQLVADCLWPVEARFVLRAVMASQEDRCFQGPYPFYDVATFMAAAGLDPLGTYDRLPEELPAHNPLNDSRQSARLLFVALGRLPLMNV